MMYCMVHACNWLLVIRTCLPGYYSMLNICVVNTPYQFFRSSYWKLFSAILNPVYDLEHCGDESLNHSKLSSQHCHHRKKICVSGAKFWINRVFSLCGQPFLGCATETIMRAKPHSPHRLHFCLQHGFSLNLAPENCLPMPVTLFFESYLIIP